MPIYLGQNSAEQFGRRLLVDVIDLRGPELGGCLVDGSGVGWPDADARRLGCFQSLLALLFRSFLRHVDIDFADFLDGQHTLGHQALRDYRLEFVEQNIDAVNLARE